MDFWVMGDPHFEHKNIAEYCNRPDNFAELILGNLGVISTQDVLICLGDVAFKRPDYWHIRLLNAVVGPCWLVLGNHDKQTMTWYMRKGWAFVGQCFTMKLYGYKILFTHEPRELGDHDFNIHGHLHNTGHRPATLTDRHILYAPENEDYCPVRVQRLITNQVKGLNQ